ncbi:MAG: BglG family transcription antiterminator [Suipraeoptans sp.]
MNSKHFALLKVLENEKTSVTAAYLSEKTGFSVRSVKNYVQEINTDKSKGVPQTYLERSYYIIKIKLIDNEEINAFDLCEDLFISYSSLKTHLAKMNKTFERFHVKFQLHDNKLNIEGNETSKRKLVGHIIFEESRGNFLNLNTLRENFSGTNIDKLSTLVSGILSDCGYSANDFSFMNLLLHILIMVERINHGEVVEDSLSPINNVTDNKLLDALNKMFQNEFGISMSVGELNQIYILLTTNVNHQLNSKDDDLSSIVDNDIITLTNKLVRNVYDTYGVRLGTDNFILPFAIHLKGLLNRLNLGTFNRNPMLDSIKSECRIIYDIAVYISLSISKLTEKKINENEIAYIALHVGSELERQLDNKGKIKTILLCPDYGSIKTTLYNQLVQNYSNEIEIITSVTSPDSLSKLNFDLLFTTIEVPRGNWIATQLLSPFQLDKKRLEISDTISKVRLYLKKEILRNNFSDFFLEDLFYCDNEFKTQSDLLETVCHDMEVLGCVNSDFLSQVRTREAAATTAFGKIAIPHSIHMDSIRTCIAVIISKDGIQWENGNVVNLVLVTSINQMDRRYFADIYEALISIFDDDDTFNYICDISDFKVLNKLLTS